MFKINRFPPAVNHQATKQHYGERENESDKEPGATTSSLTLTQCRTFREQAFLSSHLISAWAISHPPGPSPSQTVLERQYGGVLIKDCFTRMVHEGVSQTEISCVLNLRQNELKKLSYYMISKEFICKAHMAPIAKASRHRKFMVSFRLTGEETLKRLKTGAAAKGHDILEKTIKASSLEKAYGGRADEIFSQLKEANLTGYVGHWNAEGLAGIYVNDPHMPNGVSILPLNINNLSEVLEKLNQLAPNWQTKVFTGDYDMHDMVTFTSGCGRPYTPLSGSVEERNIINEINRSVAEVDPSRTLYDTVHNMVRHGPQVNFVAHMKMHEAEMARNGLVGSIARPGAFPLAVINRGEWMLVSNMAELLGIYRDLRSHMKETWKPDGSLALLANEGDTSDRVFLRRRSSASSQNTDS